MPLGPLRRALWCLTRVIPPEIRPTWTLIWQIRWDDGRERERPVRALYSLAVFWDRWLQFESRAFCELVTRPEGRRRAIRALSSITTEELIARADHVGATCLLQYLADYAEAAPELLRWRTREDVPVGLRMEAARGLNAAEAVPALLDLLCRPGFPTAEIFWLLGKLRETRAIARVRRQLHKIDITRPGSHGDLVRGAVAMKCAEGWALIDEIEPLLRAELLASDVASAWQFDPPSVDLWLFSKCIDRDPPQMTYLRRTLQLLRETERCKRSDAFYVAPGDPDWFAARKRLQERLGIQDVPEGS
jgi:hypothetical protein